MTIHPVVVHYKQERILSHKKIVIISNDRNHTAAAVFAFIKKLVVKIKQQLPELTNIHYLTIAVALQTADNHIDPALPTTLGPKIPNVDSETPISGAKHLLRSAGISPRQAPRIVKELTLQRSLVKELNELSPHKSAGFCQATTPDQQGA